MIRMLDENKSLYQQNQDLASGRVVLNRSDRRRAKPAHQTSNQVSTFNYNMVYESQIPDSYKEAEDSSNWRNAMSLELQAMEKYQVWELVDTPKDRSIIKNKWVFNLKEDAFGNFRYKARLVAKGYSQIKGVDYEETYSPVVKLDSLKLLLTLGVKKGMYIRQVDVNTAFLNGFLNESIYMEIPQGHPEHGSGKACLLKKALYGLKQAPKQWNERIVSFLNRINFLCGLQRL